MSEEHVSRRGILTGGVAALAGLGSALAVTAAPRDAHADDAADVAALANVRLRALETVRVYDAAIGYLMPMPEGAFAAALLTRFRQQHRDAAALLATIITSLGGTPELEGSVRAPSAPTGFTLSTVNYLKYAANLSRQHVSENANRVSALGNARAAEAVAAIVGTQSQQFMVLYLLVRSVVAPGAQAASMLDELVPRSFVAVASMPASSLTSVPDLTFTS